MAKMFKTPKGTELPFLNLKGKDYLQVTHRLVWFREEKPDWSIETELIAHTEEISLARAVIKDPTGRTISTGHKEETRAHFMDHAEKAESGAVGRALAMLGYGTAFAQELEENERIVDSPLNKQKPTTGVTDSLDYNKKISSSPAQDEPLFSEQSLAPVVSNNKNKIENWAPSAKEAQKRLANQSKDFANYVFKVGKFKDKTVKSVPANLLKGWVEYCEKTYTDIKGDMAEGIENAKLYLNS